jgi:hypothetical protein
VLLGEAEPKAEGEDEEAAPEEPAEPKGPTKELLFEVSACVWDIDSDAI